MQPLTVLSLSSLLIQQLIWGLFGLACLYSLHIYNVVHGQDSVDGLTSIQHTATMLCHARLEWI